MSVVREGDRVQAPRGMVTTVYDIATCTETGNLIVIHGSRNGTLTTPLRRIESAYKVIHKGARSVADS